MANSQHPQGAPRTLESVAQALGVSFTGAGSTELTSLHPLDTAGEGSLSFLDNPKYVAQAEATKAAAVILKPSLADKLPEGVCALLSDAPYATYARALDLFYPYQPQFSGISDKAFVSDTAKLGQNVTIEPFAYIADGVKIADGCVISSGAHIGNGVSIGANTRIGANASIVCAEIGAECIIHAGSAIGQDGFGFAVDASGEMPQVLKVNQIGMVRIGNRVEIGANTTVDRGSLSDTIIGDDTKIDNLVQIGHNVKMGAFCQIVAQAGVAGSTTLGNGVVAGGQSGFVGHIQVADEVMISARSAVTKNITEKGIYAGFPAIPVKQWRRMQAAISRLGGKK